MATRTVGSGLLRGLSRMNGLIVATIAGGLLLDYHWSAHGQFVVSCVTWAVALGLWARSDPRIRPALLACLIFATAGEIFLSLVWGLYEYRLRNIPLFVPPGHVLMLLLGLRLAERMPEAGARLILGCAGLYSVAVAAAGIDTLGVALFAVFAGASYFMPSQRRLYASTFMLSLALELYGTWLGNWSWAAEVPRFDLVTTNPPGAAGAFYCALDALVAAASLQLAPRWRAWTARAKADVLALGP